jgi:hypothetical protein
VDYKRYGQRSFAKSWRLVYFALMRFFPCWCI